MPPITIAVATYNRAALLPRAVESVLSQNFTDFELLLIDHGSRDDGRTRQCCETYAEKDKRIRFVPLAVNQGLPYVRNVILQQAQGDFIGFVDDDDYCEPGMYSHLFSMIAEYGADIAVTGCVDEYDGHAEEKYVFPERYILDGEQGLWEFLKREKFHTAPPTKLFRRSLFDGLSFPEGRYMDDIHVIYKVFGRSRRTVVQGLPMYHFYKHGDNSTSFITTNRLHPELLDEYLLMQDERVAYIAEHHPSLQREAAYERVSYMLSMIDKISRYRCDDCFNQRERMIYFLQENRQAIQKFPCLTKGERELLDMIFKGKAE